jgi:hypothetical protein
MNNLIASVERKFKQVALFVAVAGWIVAASASARAQTAPQHGSSPSQPQPAPAPAATVPADQAAARAKAEKAAAKLKAPTDAGDFYIVSSISIAQKQIVLKLPTEVTLLVQTNAQTQFLDETGKPLTLKDLRAGDTVFVVVQKTATGAPIVQRLQRGGMTVDLLHKKYMSGS